MNPLVVKKLLENAPEFVEFRAFLALEANKLNTLEGIEATDESGIALEVKARVIAHKKLMDILSPLLNVQEILGGVDRKEYDV